MKIIDRSRLQLAPLAERVHGIDLNIIKSLAPSPYRHLTIDLIAGRIAEARKQGREIILMMGGHVIRAGVQRYIIDLMDKGYITCIAMNGACIIHDYEFALVGATTECVAKYIKNGRFGLWKETGQINDIINEAYRHGNCGLGAAIGKAISEGDFPHKDISLLAACHRLNVPATVHVSIGFDIIHEHPNFDGAAAGATSYLDFMQFAGKVLELENGVIMNFGSAVTGPEVFLKALSMARNISCQADKDIRKFTTFVSDLHDLPDNVREEPPKDNAAYYFRPWKTMLARTVADGGEGFYLKGNHADTIPALWTALEKNEGN